MYLFFNRPDTHSSGLVHPPSWVYPSSGLARNISILKEYYSRTSHAVASTHILSQVLNLLAVSYTDHIEVFYRQVLAKAAYLTKALKMTSPISEGSFHKGHFFGSGMREVYISLDDWVNPYKVASNWQSYPSVKVLASPITNLSAQIPDGMKRNTETGTAVISIHIPALAIQYREFLLRELKKVNAGEARTTENFIYAYILPNMLESLVDSSLVNRFISLSLHAPMGESLTRHAVYTHSYESYVDSVYRTLLKRVKSLPMTYSQILKTIPLVSTTNASEFLKLPDLAPTRQVNWAMSLARLEHVDMLTSVASNNGNSLNRADNNDFVRELTWLARSGSNLWRADPDSASAARDIVSRIDGRVFF